MEGVGRFCVRRKWTVLAMWAVAIVGLAFAASALGTRTVDNPSLPGTGSQKAADILDRDFPGQTNASSPVVFAAKSGRIDAGANRAAVERALTALRQTPDVSSVSDPFSATTVSADGRIAYATVQMDVAPTKLDRDTADDVVRSAQRAGPGVDAAVGSLIGAQASAETADPSEAIGLVVAMIVLLFAFGSVVAMGMPILTALLALGAGLSLVTVVGHVIPVPTVGPTLGSMIGLGVGIDYALFLITRHREHIHAGMSVQESIPRTVATAGGAVVFAGSTVIIALLSLSLAGIPIVRSLGYSSAIVVAIAVLAANTLLPALLAIAGKRIDALPLPRMHRKGPKGAGYHGWARWAHAVVDRPWPALVAGIVILAALAVPALNLQLGQANDGTAAKDTQQRQAYDLLADGFGPGFNGPLLLAVAGAPSEQQLRKLAGDIQATPDVVAVTPPVPGRNGSVLLTVIPKTDPSAEETANLVKHLRAEVIPQAGVDAAVGGLTAYYADLAQQISDRLPQVILTVLGLSFVLLLLAFRSIVLPIKAAVMNLLSIGAAYGVVTLVFQDGFARELIGINETVPIVSFVPLMMFAILFGLSMDYEVFLLTAVQERWHETRDAHDAVVDGIARTGRVITSAALIMVAVFGAFIANPDPTVKQFGLGMAVAVAVDATIVRCLLVPATMSLLGRWSWWLPGWLDRILPHMTIEAPPDPSLRKAEPEPEPAR